MTLRFFTDLIDALGKVVGSVKTLVNLPATERAAIRQTVPLWWLSGRS